MRPRLPLIFIIEVLRLPLRSGSLWLTALDGLGLYGRLIILSLSFLVTLIIVILLLLFFFFLSIFFVFLVLVCFAFAVLVVTLRYIALSRFVGIGIRGGGFGALDTVVGVGSSGGFRAGFALFGRGCCGVDQSELQSKRGGVKTIQHSW
jgi:hypothetical protein